jgi:hypothetical protein
MVFFAFHKNELKSLVFILLLALHGNRPTIKYHNFFKLL